MAVRPPALLKTKPRKPWTQSKPSPRLRGRAGLADRRSILSDEPLCRICANANRVTAATVVDHIVPLFQGGTDDRTNKQALCTPCHDIKSKAERAQAVALTRGVGRKFRT